MPPPPHISLCLISKLTQPIATSGSFRQSSENTSEVYRKGPRSVFPALPEMPEKFRFLAQPSHISGERVNARTGFCLHLK